MQGKGERGMRGGISLQLFYMIVHARACVTHSHWCHTMLCALCACTTLHMQFPTIECSAAQHTAVLCEAFAVLQCSVTHSSDTAQTGAPTSSHCHSTLFCLFFRCYSHLQVAILNCASLPCEVCSTQHSIIALHTHSLTHSHTRSGMESNGTR